MGATTSLGPSIARLSRYDWTPILDLLDLKCIANLLLCGNHRLNNVIFKSVTNATQHYDMSMSNNWPTIVSSFAGLQSLTLKLFDPGMEYGLRGYNVSSLPPTLRSLRANIRGLDFASSALQQKSLTHLSIRSLTPLQISELPPSLTYLSLGPVPFKEGEEVQFPPLLQTVKIRSCMPLDVIASLPRALHTLSCGFDWEALLRRLEALPQGLTHLRHDAEFAPPNLAPTPLPKLQFPPSLKLLDMGDHIDDQVLISLPKTLETLWFVTRWDSTIRYADLPPNLTDCTYLGVGGADEIMAGFPRGLKRLRVPEKNNKPRLYTLSVLDEEDPSHIPRTLEHLDLLILADTIDDGDSEGIKPTHLYSRLLHLPPAIHTLAIHCQGSLVSSTAVGMLFEAVNGLNHLTDLTVSGYVFIDAFYALNAKLKRLNLSLDNYRHRRVLSFHESPGDDANQSVKIEGPPAPSSPSSKAIGHFSWSQELEHLYYCYTDAIGDDWMRTLPPSLTSLKLVASFDSTPWPSSSVLRYLPPGIIDLSIEITDIPQGILSVLPRTLRHLTIFCPSKSSVLYSWEDLQSLPMGLRVLCIASHSSSSSEDLSKFKEARRKCLVLISHSESKRREKEYHRI